MQAHPLDGLKVFTPDGERTIRVTGSERKWNSDGEPTSNLLVWFYLEEEPSQKYGLELFENFLVTPHLEKVEGLLALWFTNGQPANSVLVLSETDVTGPSK